MKILFYALAIALSALTTITAKASDTIYPAMEFTGFVTEFSESGMHFIELSDNKNRRIITLGGSFEFTGDIESCIKRALENNTKVKVSTKYTVGGESGLWAHLDDFITCTAISKPTSPLHGIYTYTAEGMSGELVLSPGSDAGFFEISILTQSKTTSDGCSYRAGCYIMDGELLCSVSFDDRIDTIIKIEKDKFIISGEGYMCEDGKFMNGEYVR